MSRCLSLLRVLAHILFLRPFVKVYSGLTVVGKENLRQLDRYIIIANHNSHLDVVLLFALLPVRKILHTRPVADKSYFSQSRIVFHLVKFLFDPLWVSRGESDRGDDPLAEIRERIDGGCNIIAFPEGTRGEPGEMQRFRSGIGRVAARYPEMPIVPVFMAGPERALPKTSFLLLPFWNRVVIGPPQVITGNRRDITHTLENTLVELSRSESAGKHRRRAKSEQPPLSIAFLGIDGSGKSTLSKRVALDLSRASRICLVSDALEFFEQGKPKEIQPLLVEKVRTAIGGYAKKARSLKVYKVPKMAELLLRNHLHGEAGRWYLPDRIILDGSPLLNMVAWAVLYKEDIFSEENCAKAIALLCGGAEAPGPKDPLLVECPELVYLCRLKLNRLRLPDAVLFLDVPPALACRRIESRKEQRQVHETEDKLGRLRGAYLKVCGVIEREFEIPTLKLDGEASLEQLTSEGTAFVHTCSGRRRSDL